MERLCADVARLAFCVVGARLVDPDATLDDLREAVATLEDTERISRRVLGGAHPLTSGVETHLLVTRAVLRARSASP